MAVALFHKHLKTKTKSRKGYRENRIVFYLNLPIELPIVLPIVLPIELPIVLPIVLPLGLLARGRGLGSVAAPMIAAAVSRKHKPRSFNFLGSTSAVLPQGNNSCCSSTPE